MNALIKQSVDYSTIQKKMQEKKNAVLTAKWSGSCGASRIALPPLLPTPSSDRCSTSGGGSSIMHSGGGGGGGGGGDRGGGYGGGDWARLATVFTPIKLIDLVMQGAAEVLPEGFEIVPDIQPREVAHTEYLKAGLSISIYPSHPLFPSPSKTSSFFISIIIFTPPRQNHECVSR